MQEDVSYDPETMGAMLDMYLDGVYQLDPFYTRFCKDKKSSAMLIRDVAPDRYNLTEYYRRYRCA